MERHDVSQKKHNTPNKPEKEEDQNQSKRSPETEEKSIMERADEEKDGIFGVLGERQVGVVMLREPKQKTEKANGPEDDMREMVIGTGEKVYNTGQQSLMWRQIL